MISSLILVSIILPIILAIALNFTTFQNFVVGIATEFISSKVGYTISIGRIDVRPFHRLELEDLYVEDLEGDTLLYAKEFKTSVAGNGLLRGNILLSNLIMSDAKLLLYQDSTQTLNLARVLDRILNRDPDRVKKPLDVKVLNFSLENMFFRSTRYNPNLREVGINFQDIELSNLDLKGEDLKIMGDSIHLKIDNMAFVDKSGFQLDQLSSDGVAVSSRGFCFEQLRFISSESNLYMPRIDLLTKDWKGFSNFEQDVTIDAQIRRSTISSSTVGFLAPSLIDWNLVADGVDMEYYGTVADMEGSIESLNIGGTRLKASFDIEGLPDVSRTKFNLTIENLDTDSYDIEYIVNNITKGKLSSDNIALISKFQDISFSGSFDGKFSNFSTGGHISTTLGDIKVDLNLQPLRGEDMGFEGSMSTSELDLGRIVGSESVGEVSMSGSVDGYYGSEGVFVNTNAKLEKFRFNDYNYNEIVMDGEFKNSNFIGEVRGSGEDLSFEFDGMLDFNDETPRYNFDLKLTDVDLVKTNFNRRDSISKLSCRVMAKVSGTNIDNVNGELNIYDLLYTNEVDSVETGEISLLATNSDDSKRLVMNSSFATAEFMSRSSYSDMFSYFSQTLRTYLPSMGGTLSDGSNRAERELIPSASDGYYVMKVDVHEANNVAGIFVPGLSVASGSSVVFMFNPKRDLFSLSLNSDYIERGNMFVSDLSLNGRNQGDSISLYVRAEDLFVANIYMPNLSIVGGARNNRIDLDTRFGVEDGSSYAYLSTTTLFVRDSLTNTPQVRFRFNPSSVEVDGREWLLQAQDIVADTTGVRVDGFVVRGQGQSLSIDGMVSRNSEDTLKLALNNFDISPLSRFVESKGYSLNGRASGYVNAISAVNSNLLMAKIDLDSLRVNSVDIPRLSITSEWDFEERQVGVYVDRTDTNKRVVDGYYRPSDKNYSALIDIDDLDISLIDPLLSGVVGSTEGSADLYAEVHEQDGKPIINGVVNIDQLKTEVLFTNVEYYVSDVHLDINSSVMTLSPAVISDGAGGSGTVNLTFDAQNLRNLKYDLRVQAQELLSMNTTVMDNELFYGTIYANGVVNIKGDRLGTEMLVSASTSGPSEFYMPLSGSESAAEADFIVFSSGEQMAMEDEYTTRKQAIMHERSIGAATRSNFNMNMQLSVDPRLEFQLVIDPTVGDIIRGRGNGDINMRINPLDNQFTMTGNYEITEGSYLFTLRNIINKKFVIEAGSTIQWDGDPVDAQLDITAIYGLKTSLAPLLNDDMYDRRVSVDCMIHLGDMLSKPLITFDVEVPNSDPETQTLVSSALNSEEIRATQFLYLLALNSFSSENSNSDYSVNVGTTGTAVTGIEFLSNQLSNWLSNERFSLVPRYVPRSSTSDDEFGFEFSAELIKDRLVIEGEGSYGGNTLSSTSSSTDFSNDLTAYWLFDQAGNIKAKAFTRTVDSFDENQGLQESGIGISYRQDFDSFKELVENFRSRINSKK